MKKNLNIILKPTDIRFTEKYIEIMDSFIGRYRLLYENIVTTVLRIYNQESEDWYEPEVTEITSDMKGDLVFRDNKGVHWIIHTDLMEKTAGAMLSELVMRAIYILIGRQSWVDLEDENAFAEVSGMVDLMRQCRDINAEGATD